MSESFSPEEDAEPSSLYSTVFLSHRDLSLQVPINFVTQPGVSFRSACFPQHKFEDDAAGDCLSNLLSGGYRRLVIDLFWDQGRQVWSFCPAQISSSASAKPTPRALPSVQAPSGMPSGLASVTPSSLGGALPSMVPVPNSPDLPLISIGPYSCTKTINLSVLISLLFSYIETTQNTLNAHLIYIVLNIHAAASSTAPSDPAPRPTVLPNTTNQLGNLFDANLTNYIYGPSKLVSDRADLNNSWYEAPAEYRPLGDYYSTSKAADGIVSTEDGWPSESYIEFWRSRRLLLSWGTIDPQMANYNFGADDAVIYPSGFIENLQDHITVNSTGGVETGCFLPTSINDDINSEANASWAVASDVEGFDYPTAPDSPLDPLFNLASNLTNCGISPVLNTTLLNQTALQNFLPYQNYSYSTIWSWAPGEPRNSSDQNDIFRCAASNLALDGHWTVEDCSQKLYASCQAIGQPYNWTTTSYQISYSFAGQACPDSYAFAVPRTALENAYLTRVMRRQGRSKVWVNFNSLNVKFCWVTEGANATCPYSTTALEDAAEKIDVLVPSIAAVIVLVVTALTIFVKAAGNRTSRKRTRRGRRAGNGYVYEGVPS
ncbi:hypothetical protein F5884DRAFT_428378 [Xylogone sp. PMI_703]|nr:hypothetical protein F5884DRAFT_428378 [Xylogone sp. PMI_703]